MEHRKERIDVLLVEQGFYESREKAKAAIMAGLVLADEERIEKAGMKVSRESTLKVKGSVHPYVSRGGLKLEKALRQFNIDLKSEHAGHWCFHWRLHRLCASEWCKPCVRH